MYVEITKEAFDRLVPETLRAYEIDSTELAHKQYFCLYGVVCLSIFNHVASVSQYYIQDVNS
jgi:hypothetical protein